MNSFQSTTRLHYLEIFPQLEITCRSVNKIDDFPEALFVSLGGSTVPLNSSVRSSVSVNIVQKSIIYRLSSSPRIASESHTTLL